MLTIPPFCPNKDCLYHNEDEIEPSKRKTWYQKDGSYFTKVNNKVQRFVCTCCGKRFSAQTFSIDYGVKRTVPYSRIFSHLISGSGIRSLARTLRVSEKVIINRIGRLSRNAVALHARLRGSFALQEGIVADGFESFTGSQYYPNNINLAVGKESQYLYCIDYAHIRRKGRMREDQMKRREELEKKWKAPGGDIIRSFTRLVRNIDRYRGKRCNDPVEFSRDVNNSMDRLWIYCVYHNCMKPYRVGVPREKRSHGECAGISRSEIDKLWKTFFTRRALVSKLDLSESEWYSWYRCYATPGKYEVPWYPRYAAM